MHTFEFIMNLMIEGDRQISPQLADQMLPLYLSQDDSPEIRKRQTDFYLAYNKMITDLGESEHSSDWDPSIIITLTDGTKIGDEPGYHHTEWIITQPQDEDKERYYLLLDHPNEDGEEPGEDEDCYHRIPLSQIANIQFNYH